MLDGDSDKNASSSETEEPQQNQQPSLSPEIQEVQIAQVLSDYPETNALGTDGFDTTGGFLKAENLSGE